MRACCADDRNLRPEPVPPEAPRGTLLRVCVVCGARHIEVIVDPLRFGLRMPP